ncbi:enoyl-CoA hydratase/isomerase family protein [Bradyrhizobium sp. U87765 SZCCT0131]|uniref:3-hydroxyacyl-CoA dehydrogenase NAD-binding domain-containing protein n=1 Tax=unclassified Bradyrhizobium TaxID=2631580 RepID=UPI001BABDFFF|nr:MULTISPECIES: 3-hydroxyacyl-CoA dehydrogenase NAD-binding domain-containing protein [unclassified Bradyrhizobium]MBR1218246.1 enoyl-CoA hydratase/isomerase family protein [Bradyrhizobium sp. U87765 SZCCT0131]MBR1260808.1 enoyl-CoA hydratase/isomerase family protein [Bradyrhizobium sp. U87765 SZCCT0134]MBR1303744.1 enoyl-CoA hydratase/isomerase family protein [Bradyrhizobium sp. U87765 SZCCT0110]MBR1319350.1 enoyl-CoA hydratase/isomerase family protein [Bradyrhizobium sp. U87765 SZCCT0109]MB
MDSRILDILSDRVLELGPKPSADGTYRHFHLTRDNDGIAWLLFDRAGASANSLSAEVMEELDKVLAALEAERPTGLVIRSAKPSGFIAGADINEFRGASDPRQVELEMVRAHAVVYRLEALKLPTVAVIHGFCLGGGLEIALACNMRIAIDNARFGFPEVMLGLHPGLGGPARLTELINPAEAMTLMLTGKTIDARRAKSLGLVDAVTQERHVRNAVKDAVFGRLKRARPGALNAGMNFAPVRGVLASRMRSEAAKAAPREHYPAPYALIDLWEKHGGDKVAMLAHERTSFARLMVTPTAQNLIRVFFLRERMKKLAGGASEIKHVHVIGAGAMGGDIAAWCANQGLRVTLADMKAEPIAGAVKRAAELFGKIIRKPVDVRDALDRLIPDMAGEGVRAADLVIEAVPERLDLKQKVYAALEPRMKSTAILATNTSSIPLQDLRTTLAAPQRLVGLHFFNPVSRLQLVEVVSHDAVDPQVLAAATAFVGAIDRLPLPVKSSPGFLVNRALTPYMLEAMVMLDEKIDMATIDAAAEKFGMPMGPIELADQVGLDICLAVGDMLRTRMGDSLPAAPDWLREKVAKGELGRKTGRGFYAWKDGKAQKTPATTQPTAEMTDRLILPMSNVCVACLREGIVADAEVVDGAMIFGTGYAPFRGGPLNYARTRGVADVVAALQGLANRFGDRFKPDAGWDDFRTTTAETGPRP